MAYQRDYANLTVQGDALKFDSSYKPGLVADIKARIPAHARKWDNTSKAWLVDPAFGQVVADLARTHLHVNVSVPVFNRNSAKTGRLIELRYLGRCKAGRGGNAEPSAFGWVNGGWNAIFPESVLRDWFSAGLGPMPTSPTGAPAGPRPTTVTNLYEVLMLKQNPVPSIDEVRSAYRRMARQWHPDVCREPDAAAQFRRIEEARTTLTDPGLRARYDAGLRFAALSANKATTGRFGAPPPPPPKVEDGFRSPLRCGYVLCEGVEVLGRFNVTKITKWEDITDAQGRVLTVSWPLHAETFEERWVAP